MIVILVGRVLHYVNLESRNKGVYSLLTLLIASTDGGLSDSIPVVLKSRLAIKSSKYIKVGSIVGVKARLKYINKKVEVHAEKITFINSKEIK